MLAVTFALHSFIHYFRNHKIVWNTDNYAASCILRTGSSKSHLQTLAESVFERCKRNNIDFKVKWIPREYISFADRISKQIDHDDWEITSSYFIYLNNLWGPFTIDLFADDGNAKVERFYSKFHCPGTSGVNAFLYSWAKEENFIVPPVYLVPQVLQHMKWYNTRGVLVTPFWKSAAFYPMIVTNDGNFRPFVREVLYVDGHVCTSQGKNKDVFIGSPLFKNQMMAIKLDFSYASHNS